MTTDRRVQELWLARDFLRDNPTGFTAVTRTKIRRLERELRDEGVDIETRRTEGQETARRLVVHVEGDPSDLGSSRVTHADRYCVVCERYPGCVREATAKEVDKMLMRQLRLERRSAPRAFRGAALGAMDAAGEDLDRVFRDGTQHVLAVAPVRDTTHNDGIDVEPEAEREHQGTVAPDLRVPRL